MTNTKANNDVNEAKEKTKKMKCRAQQEAEMDLKITRAFWQTVWFKGKRLNSLPNSLGTSNRYKKTQVRSMQKHKSKKKTKLLGIYFFYSVASRHVNWKFHES